jgi:hypothetical protein
LRNLENLVDRIAKAIHINNAGDQYCSELREKELESKVPIQKVFHFNRKVLR